MTRPPVRQSSPQFELQPPANKLGRLFPAQQDMNVILLARNQVIGPAPPSAKIRKDVFYVKTLPVTQNHWRIPHSVRLGLPPCRMARQHRLAGLVMTAIDGSPCIAVEPGSIGTKGDVVGKRQT